MDDIVQFIRANVKPRGVPTTRLTGVRSLPPSEQSGGVRVLRLISDDGTNRLTLASVKR